jgi:polar amino acid transport system permease protein
MSSVTGSGPSPSGRGDRLDRLALASARIPFRLKVAAVWVVIFAVLGGLFWLADYDTGWMRDNLTFIAGGLRFTLSIAVGGIVLAIVLATLGALGRISHNPIAYGISGFYVSFFRGTPLIVQMFLIYLALPQMGTNLMIRYPSLPQGFEDVLVMQAAVAGTIALGLNYGAYMTEIFRAGIQSVSGGQGEAADALGMTYSQKMRKVVLPQAFRVIIPPTGNEFIAMMKDTALVSFLGVTAASAEIFRRSQLVGKADFKNLEAYVLVAGFYWALTVIFTFFQRRLEARMSKGYVRTADTAGRLRAGDIDPRAAGSDSVGRPHGGGA